MDFSSNLLKVLSCPITGGKLTYSKTDHELISESAKVAYPIIDGIPILLVDKARKIQSNTNREQTKSSEAKKSKEPQDFRVA